MWECFLVFIPYWKCRLRRAVNWPAPERRCTPHFYTVLYGLMMFYFFYFEMLLHIKRITCINCSYNHTNKWNNASLICEFCDSESNLWRLLYLLFSFRGEGGSILSEPCWSLKNVWLANEALVQISLRRMRISHQFSLTLDMILYTVMLRTACSVHPSSMSAEGERTENSYQYLLAHVCKSCWK